MSRRDHKRRDDDNERKYELTHFSALPDYSPFELNVLDKLNLAVEDLRINSKDDAQALKRLVEDMIRQVRELLRVNDNNRENMIIMSLMSQFENNALFKGDASALFYPYSSTLKTFYDQLKKEVKIRSTQGSYAPILALDIFQVTRESVEREHKEKMKNKDAKYDSLERGHASQLQDVAKELKEKDRSIKVQEEEISELKQEAKVTKELVRELELESAKGQVLIKSQQESIDGLNQRVMELSQVIREKEGRIEQLTGRIEQLTDRLINVFTPSLPGPVLPGSVRSSDLMPRYATVSHSPTKTGEKVNDSSQEFSHEM